MNAKLAILGGSSPFTAAFFDAAIASGAEMPPLDLVLHGRNERHLEIVGQYAKRRLTPHGWTVAWSTSAAEALEGATFVVHQNRFGGLERRAASERLCVELGVAADETLGPAALLTGLLCVPHCRRIAEELRRYCPDAWVLNLTNPLSCVTALFARYGVRRCLGLCELPIVTAQAIAGVLQVPFHRLSWEYSGLNHRGFLYDLRVDGVNVFPTLLERLGDGELCTVRAKVIADLQAVPLKYFHLTQQRLAATNASRAAELMRLRERLIAELSRADEPPPALRERYLDWYPRSVVPCLTALQSTRPRMEVVTLSGSDGCARELKAMLHHDGIEPKPSPPPGGLAGQWLRRFEIHERRLMAAVLDPTPDTIERALAVDPLVPQVGASMAAAAVWKLYQESLS